MKYALTFVFTLIMLGCSSHTPMKVRFNTESLDARVHFIDDESDGPAGKVYHLETAASHEITLKIKGKTYSGVLELRRHARLTRGGIVEIPVPKSALKKLPVTIVVIQRTKSERPEILAQGEASRAKLLESAEQQGQILAVLDLRE